MCRVCRLHRDIRLSLWEPGEVEEEEELPILKPPPPKPDAPKKEHVNVVFIGHVGEVSLGVLNSLAQHLTPRVDKMSFLNLLCG